MSLLRSIIGFYIDGFRSMTVGRSLWALIIIKLLFIFLVFKMLLMPDLLERDYPDDPSRAAAVRSELTRRSTSPSSPLPSASDTRESTPPEIN